MVQLDAGIPILSGALSAANVGTTASATVPMAMVVLLVLVTGFGVWGGTMYWRMAASGRRLRKWSRDLETQAEALRQEARRARNDRDESSEVLRLQKEKTDLLRRRSRNLEKILAVSARINATRNLSELLDKVTLAVEEIIGFRKVVLHLWAEETRAFEARAFAGIREENKAQLIGIQVSKEEYAELTHVRYRFSNSYLVRAGRSDLDDVPADMLDRDAPPLISREWQSDLLLIAPLISDDGEVVGYLSLDEPVSGLIPGIVEIRHLEFLVRQATTAIESAEVYDHLARNNAELSVASEKLASLGDMKANFVANVSHELRTPLTSISAYTELLQQNMDSMGEEALSEFLKVINTESIKLTEIINDVLKLDDMKNDRVAVQQEDTDMVGLVQRLEESWKTRAQERNIRFQLETSGPEIKLHVDSLLFQQLLGHLLGNAFKFTPEGGRVKLRVEETGTAVRLVVEDSGIGIPQDKLGEIFDQFYQVDGSATREHNGQGVGLAICQDIVNHYDGRIWAENMEPAGARFTVLLPRRPAVLQPSDRLVAANFAFEPGEFMQRLMHWVSESLGTQVATLMVPDANNEHLTIRAAIGLPESVVQSTRVRKGGGMAGKVWASGRTLFIEDLTSDDRLSRDINEPRYSTPSLLCAPLLDNGRFIGVISVNNRFDGKPLDRDDQLSLESLVPVMTQLLIRYRAWRDEARDFQSIRNALRTTTPVGHLKHESLLEVCREICLATARRINLPAEELEHLAFALQFYDVGLSRVPRQVLNTPGALTEKQEREVRTHVTRSLDILKSLEVDSKVLQIILHHHENLDGSGYPTGLSGEAIPLGSRLVRLTDTLTAMLSQRPWRPAYTLEQVLAEIESLAGRVFCPRMTEVFLAEAVARAERIDALQDRGDDGSLLKRPVLERQGPTVPTK